MKKLIIFSVIVLLTSAPLLYAEGKHLLGGRCSYSKISGTCQIISITKTEESIAQANTSGGPGYEGNLVKFVFQPQEGKENNNIKFQDRPFYHLLLTNSWYPGDKFLEKYDIKEGKVFKCEKREIIKGTCAPVLFKFPDIDTSDYFESEKNTQ